MERYDKKIVTNDKSPNKWEEEKAQVTTAQ